MTHYNNGPEGMPKVERMTDSTLDWVVNGVDTTGMYLDEVGHQKLRDVMHATAEEVLARLPNWPDTAPTHTCVGKGGEYQHLGLVHPAGEVRTTLGSMEVYRDVATGELYFRTPEDFGRRMALLP